MASDLTNSIVNNMRLKSDQALVRALRCIPEEARDQESVYADELVGLNEQIYPVEHPRLTGHKGGFPSIVYRAYGLDDRLGLRAHGLSSQRERISFDAWSERFDLFEVNIIVSAELTTFASYGLLVEIYELCRVVLSDTKRFPRRSAPHDKHLSKIKAFSRVFLVEILR